MLGERITQQGGGRKTYLNIKNGAIVKRTATGEESYSYVEGRVEAIFQKNRTFRNEEVVYWYIDLRDTQSGELYSIGSPYASNTFKSIILSLASNEGLQATGRGSTIKIEPYSRNGYDKVAVKADGVKLDWATKDLPPVTETMIGGRKVKDDAQRMALICSLVERITSSLPTSANR